jgi:hypothetical protein
MKILVATDGSEYSMAALRSVAERPWPVGSEARIISVSEFLPLKEFSYLNAREVSDLGAASEEKPRSAQPRASKLWRLYVKDLFERAHRENRVFKCFWTKPKDGEWM